MGYRDINNSIRSRYSFKESKSFEQVLIFYFYKQMTKNRDTLQLLTPDSSQITNKWYSHYLTSHSCVMVFLQLKYSYTSIIYHELTYTYIATQKKYESKWNYCASRPVSGIRHNLIQCFKIRNLSNHQSFGITTKELTLFTKYGV